MHLSSSILISQLCARMNFKWTLNLFINKQETPIISESRDEIHQGFYIVLRVSLFRWEKTIFFFLFFSFFLLVGRMKMSLQRNTLATWPFWCHNTLTATAHCSVLPYLMHLVHHTSLLYAIVNSIILYKYSMNKNQQKHGFVSNFNKTIKCHCIDALFVNPCLANSI